MIETNSTEFNSLNSEAIRDAFWGIGIDIRNEKTPLVDLTMESLEPKFRGELIDIGRFFLGKDTSIERLHPDNIAVIAMIHALTRDEPETFTKIAFFRAINDKAMPKVDVYSSALDTKNHERIAVVLTEAPDRTFERIIIRRLSIDSNRQSQIMDTMFLAGSGGYLRIDPNNGLVRKYEEIKSSPNSTTMIFHPQVTYDVETLLWMSKEELQEAAKGIEKHLGPDAMLYFKSSTNPVYNTMTHRVLVRNLIRDNERIKSEYISA